MARTQFCVPSVYSTQ